MARSIINGKFYRENYITPSTTDQFRSFPIPKNSYLVVGDNRNMPDESIITKSAIIGKVV